MRFQDRVQETSTTTGTGTLTLLGAVASFRSFGSAFAVGERVPYCIVNDNGEWEVGKGIFTAGFLSRLVVHSSSNAGALVNFSAGTKAVFCSVPAIAIIDLGQSCALGARLGTQ